MRTARLTAFLLLSILAGGCTFDSDDKENVASENGPVIVLTDRNFDREVLQNSQPVLVDFWAAWCTPCLEMKPVIAELAQAYAGRVKFGQLNVEENRFTAAKYEVESLPAVLFFRDGNVVGRLSGPQTKDDLVGILESTLMQVKRTSARQQ